MIKQADIYLCTENTQWIRLFTEAATRLGENVRTFSDFWDMFPQTGGAAAVFYDLEECTPGEIEFLFDTMEELVLLYDRRGEYLSKYRCRARRYANWLKLPEKSSSKDPAEGIIRKIESFWQKQHRISEEKWKNRDGFHCLSGVHPAQQGELFRKLTAPGLHYMGGRPNMGAEKVVLNMLLREGMPQASASILTNDTGYYIQTIVSMLSGIPRWQLDRQKTQKALKKIAESYILFLQSGVELTNYIWINYTHLPETFRDIIGSPRIVFIDSFETLFTGWKEKTKKTRAELYRFLKSRCDEKEMSFIIYKNISKKVEKRKSKVPVLSDIPYLRNVKEYFNDCFLLYRGDYYDETLHNPEIPGSKELQINISRGPGFKRSEYCLLYFDSATDLIKEVPNASY